MSFPVTESEAARVWDSESRRSPYSTVADIEDEFCEDCEAASAIDGEDMCAECANFEARMRLMVTR